MKSSVVASVLLFSALSLGPTYGQVTGISGTVRDLEGKPISGAVVYAYDKTKIVPRFIKHETRSKANGQFLIKDLVPGNYEIHAYKETDGYPDTFFGFFKTNPNAWKAVRVSQSRVSNVVLELGPKGAWLNVSIRDEAGNPIPAGLAFQLPNERDPSYRTSVDPDSRVVIPAIRFRLIVSEQGYAKWQSEFLTPKSGETIPVNIRLKRQ